MTATAPTTAPAQGTREIQDAGHVDVLIVGAGVSGIGAAHHLREQFPERTFVILDAQGNRGGTWWTDRYPGVRSDSDLFTYGYRFKPWRGPSIAAVLKIWSKRYRDLGRTRTQVVCRLHAVLGELIPGGVPKVITAARAARILAALRGGSDAVEAARCELAAAFLDDLRRIDAQLRETRKKLAVAVAAAGTSLTGLFGVGPVIAAAVIGDVRDVSRFPGRDHFAAYNGTAPIEVSSGKRKVYRLSRRGNRRLNHAIHMAAITQIHHRHSQGRAYYDKKLAEGKTPERPCAH
jgi:transposase